MSLGCVCQRVAAPAVPVELPTSAYPAQVLQGLGNKKLVSITNYRFHPLPALVIIVSTLASPRLSIDLEVLPSHFGHFDNCGKCKGNW